MSPSKKVKTLNPSAADFSFEIRSEVPADCDAIDRLTMTVFGPGMFARAAFALREGIAPEDHLSFVACKGSEIIGSVRLTKIKWGEATVLMLGPLGVLHEYKSLGAGKALMATAVNEARERTAIGGPQAIILVGDLAYYERFGFQRIAPAKIQLPRPADPLRVLVCDLVDGASKNYSGTAARLEQV